MRQRKPTQEPVGEELRDDQPKHAQITRTLRVWLQHAKPGQALPAIRDLRAEFGVSQGPVDRALLELQQEGLIARRDRSGIYATGGKRLLNIALYFSIDVLAPEAGPFPRLLLKGLEYAAGQFEAVHFRHYFAAGSGYLWQNRICALERDARAHLVDGVVLFGQYGGEFGDLPVPVVSWQLLPQVKAHVAVDEEAMVRQGLAALRKRGCRRVAYLGNHTEKLPEAESAFRPMGLYHQRVFEVFLEETARLGMATRPEWTQPGTGETGITATVTNGARRFHALWNAASAKPDGLLSTDDYRSTGALTAMAELGLRPGRELQVASHVNRGSEVLAGQPIIRLEVDPAEIAAAMLKTVTGLIAGQTLEPNVVLVAPHLSAAP